MDYQKLRMYFLFILLAGALFFTFLLFLPYLSALLVAVAFSIVFQPVYQIFLRVLKGRRGLAAFLTIVVVFVGILVPLMFFGFQIFRESKDLFSQLTSEEGWGLEIFDRAKIFIEEQIRVVAPNFSVDFNELARQFLSWIVRNFSAVFSGLTQLALTLFLGFLAFYYLLKDGEKFKEKIIAFSPLSDKYDNEIFDKLEATVNSVIKGSLTIAFIQGILTGVGFTIFGVPNAALWASVAFVAALIPSIGTALVTFPGVVFLFLTGHAIGATGLAIWGMTAVGLIDNFLSPRLIQRGIAIHPFLILVSVLGGISLFGLIGFLLGPLILSFLFTMLDVYRKEFKEVGR